MSSRAENVAGFSDPLTIGMRLETAMRHMNSTLGHSMPPISADVGGKLCLDKRAAATDWTAGVSCNREGR